MKCLIFADSHGRRSDMEKIIFENPGALVIHLGDVESDVEYLRNTLCNYSICAVAGNNDLFSQLPNEIRVPFEGKYLFACHGHRHNARGGYDGVVSAALKNGCAAALYGHTHIPVCERSSGILVVNPGSIAYHGTYAILTAENGELTAEIKCCWD